MQERIVELRNILGLTQQEMADGIGIKRGTIANYEVGRNEPPESVRRTVATIKTHPLIPSDIVVRGFIIDSTTGRLEEIDNPS